jgi:aerobic carbon-monoxide dehydrogenase small subunit
MHDKLTIRLTVNGAIVEREVAVRMTLADFLRHELNLTGTHVGCEHGVCGACTILLDGLSARSCLTLAVQADGMQVTTIEGLGREDTGADEFVTDKVRADGLGATGRLGALQQAFMDCHALQCGFCTPGMLSTLTEFLRDNRAPTADEVRIAISGNLCRCTGYENIVKAALQAASVMREGEHADA